MSEAALQSGNQTNGLVNYLQYVWVGKFTKNNKIVLNKERAQQK
jgi:hypothetical protein